MKQLISNLFKVFGKYFFFSFFLIITGALYYFTITEGMIYFHNFGVGVFCLIAMPILTVLYYLNFVRDRKSKN